MKIHICDYSCGGLLEKFTAYHQGQEVKGTLADVFDIARGFFDNGLNVMIRRNPAYNAGTRKKPDMVPESITIFVDDQKFQQR